MSASETRLYMIGPCIYEVEIVSTRVVSLLELCMYAVEGC